MPSPTTMGIAIERCRLCGNPAIESIIDEKEARARRPDVFLVLPWHFRDFIVAKERPYLESGGELLFPLPRVERVRA